MDWTAIIGGALGGAFGALDSLTYTEQERAEHQLLADQTDVQRQLAAAQQTAALASAAAAEQQASTMRFVAILGAGVLGIGLVVLASRR